MHNTKLPLQGTIPKENLQCGTDRRRNLAIDQSFYQVSNKDEKYLQIKFI